MEEALDNSEKSGSSVINKELKVRGAFNKSSEQQDTGTEESKSHFDSENFC